MQDLRVQHDRLHRYVARLGAQFSENKRLQNLDDLISYFEIHASDEEQFMEVHAYPWLEEHRTEHQALLAVLRELRELDTPGLRESAGDISERVMDHLRTHDRKYVDYFCAQGVIAPNATLCSFEI